MDPNGEGIDNCIRFGKEVALITRREFALRVRQERRFKIAAARFRFVY
jgi:hypothetical protein